MADVKIDIRTRPESYAALTLKEKAKLSYTDVEAAVKKTPFKLDDLLWGSTPAKATK